jgi:DNA-binding transcriptional LysR family regulator
VEMIEVEAFERVAALGGFTRAAAALGLSQPAVSRRVELLERELGAPLFDRLPGSAGVRLTEAGERFLPYARAVLAAAREGAAAVLALEQDGGGAVTLALVGALATAAVVGRLQAFRAAAPGVRLTLRTGTTDEVAALVRAGEAHLGLLRELGGGAEDLESLSLEPERPTVVCGPQHPLLRAAGPIPPEALDGQTWVTLDAAVLRRLLALAGLRDPELIAIDSREAQVRLIAAGFGIGLVPRHAVARDLAAGTLRPLPVPALGGQVGTRLVWRRGYLSAAARRLRATLCG